MGATYIQDGNHIDYTPAADLAAGDVVVQGELVGIADRALPAGQVGSLAVAGVFDVPKAAALAFAAGAKVYWDVADGNANDDGVNNKLLGKAIFAAAEADATVRVRLSQ